MNINKNNYEAFFLDYHEGNLTPQQVADLLLFVEQHPELKEELESFENFTIEDYSTISYKDKSSLKKEITDANREEYFIKAVEGGLNTAEKTLLENYLKQHPKYLVDFNLFQKTKVVADAAIVFENKDVMKKDLALTLSKGKGNKGEALISLVEGLLSDEESSLLNKQIVADAHLQKELALYQQTKLVADTNIVFENKDSLKRKERRVIPLYYYMAAAAAILLLFGLFFLNNNNNGQQFADKKVVSTKNNIAAVVTPKSIDKINNEEVKTNSNTNLHSASSVKKHNVNKNNSIPVSPVNNVAEIIKKEEQPIAENQNKETIVENKEPIAEVQKPIVNNEAPATNRHPEPVEGQQPVVASKDFLSLKEMAVAKIKENTLDEKALAEEKKAGRLNKLNGWDLARAAAKGFNKLTGREVKVEPKYNDKGDVTSYAFAAGSFEITRGSR